MPLLTTKDLARELNLHPRTVKRWWRRLGVRPDACCANGCHRWSPEAVARLRRKWLAYWAKHGYAASEATAKWNGSVKAAREKRQLRLKLSFQ